MSKLTAVDKFGICTELRFCSPLMLSIEPQTCQNQDLFHLPLKTKPAEQIVINTPATNIN
jgi:hypothetical protein